jgi:hypothetical protein
MGSGPWRFATLMKLDQRTPSLNRYPELLEELGKRLPARQVFDSEIVIAKEAHSTSGVTRILAASRK